MRKRVAIFDLDNTLIDTSMLETFRKGREWDKVYKNFNKTYLDEKIKKFINKLVKETFEEVIIVTSAPKGYAEKLLKYHQFLTDKHIVGYHDTEERKPSPLPYLKAIEKLGEFDEIFIFGDDEKDFIAADNLKKLINKKIYKVGCSWYYKCNYKEIDRELTKDDI